MKRFMCCLIILILFVFSSCSNSNYKDFILVSSEENYAIYEYCYDSYLSDYVYFIFDNNGKKLDADYCQSKEPQIRFINNYILEYTLPIGTNSKEYKYYDVNNGLISKSYQNIYYVHNDEIVYIDYEDSKTIVCYKKIFDDEFILKKLLDMDGITTTEYEISIDKNMLYVTHIKGTEYEEITEKFLIE